MTIRRRMVGLELEHLRMPSEIAAATTDYSAPNVEQALAAFSLLREYFQGALIVDKEARITWIDPRYRKLLKLDPGFNPYGLPVEEVIPHSLMRRVIETGRPIL